MKNLSRRLIIPLLIFIFSSAKATHIVGGDITVQSMGSNNFQVTLTLFFDCINGSPAAFDPSITIGVYDKVTNAMQQATVIPFVDSLTLVLGDTCFIPTNLCVRKQRYIGTINLPNNPNGYYLSWSRCCRNGIINNIVNPGASGNVFYCEVPDPVLLDNTPVFTSYPDAYMCQGFPNADNFSATDADGDSLVYSLVDPYDCATTGICSSVNPLPPNPPAQPGPYGIVPWQAPYASANMMGDPAQMIGNPGGILFTTPPSLGLFVICVKVEEFRNAVKIGEIRRDVQYSVLNCNIPHVSVSGPNPLCLGQSTTLLASGGTTYSWSTGATTTSIFITPSDTGVYNYYVATSNGLCSALDSIQILVVPAVTVSALALNDTLCPGDTTTLFATVTGGGGYLWSPSSSLSCTMCPNPVASPSTSTTYTVVSSNGFGCSSSATVNIATVGATPVITGNTPICLGQSSTLTATGSTVYSWSTGATTSSIVVSPTSSGTYTYTLTGGVAPCIGTANFVLVVDPASVATATASNDTICIGSSTVLTATGGGTYSWNTGGQSASISVTPAVTTTYTVLVNALACPAIATVNVVVLPLPTVTANPGDTICLGDPNGIQLIAYCNSPGVSYSWVPGVGLIPSGSVANPVAYPGQSNTYTVYVSNAAGCSAAATVPVTVGAIPYISAIASPTICVGDSAQLNANVSNVPIAQQPVTWYWSPPNTLNNPALQNPTTGAVTSTTFVVTVTDAFGCTDDTTAAVSVQTVPSISFTDWTPDLTCDGYIIPWKANVSSNGQSVFWNFGDGSTLTTYAPNTNAGPHSYPFNGTYNVIAIVYNGACKDTIDTTIVINDISSFLTIKPANVFTPNSDTRNECFHPVFDPLPNSGISPDTLKTLSECVYMEIWDRWGVKMFETTDTEKCWDGTNRKGHPVKEGTYFYIAKFGEIIIKGNVAVLR